MEFAATILEHFRFSPNREKRSVLFSHFRTENRCAFFLEMSMENGKSMRSGKTGDGA